MARLDSTAMWFEKGEDPETIAETLSIEDCEPDDEATTRRRVPTLAWIVGGVAVALFGFCKVLTHVAHASRVADAELPSLAIANQPPAQIAAPPLASAAPTTKAPIAASAPVTASAPVAASAPAKTANAPTSHRAALAAKSRTVGAHAPRVAPEVLAGENLLRRGRPAPALAKFQQLIARQPDDVRALRGACSSLAQLGRLNEAARVCRRALDRAPGDLATRRALATIYYNGGAYKWSAAEWRHVVQQAPNDVHARRALRAAESRS